jgi:hypothetical protein
MACTLEFSTVSVYSDVPIPTALVPTIRPEMAVCLLVNQIVYTYSSVLTTMRGHEARLQEQVESVPIRSGLFRKKI